MEPSADSSLSSTVVTRPASPELVQITPNLDLIADLIGKPAIDLGGGTKLYRLEDFAIITSEKERARIFYKLRHPRDCHTRKTIFDRVVFNDNCTLLLEKGKNTGLYYNDNRFIQNSDMPSNVYDESVFDRLRRIKSIGNSLTLQKARPLSPNVWLKEGPSGRGKLFIIDPKRDILETFYKEINSELSVAIKGPLEIELQLFPSNNREDSDNLTVKTSKATHVISPYGSIVRSSCKYHLQDLDPTEFMGSWWLMGENGKGASSTLPVIKFNSEMGSIEIADGLQPIPRNELKLEDKTAKKLGITSLMDYLDGMDMTAQYLKTSHKEVAWHLALAVNFYRQGFGEKMPWKGGVIEVKNIEYSGVYSSCVDSRYNTLQGEYTISSGSDSFSFIAPDILGVALYGSYLFSSIRGGEFLSEAVELEKIARIFKL